MMCEIWRICTVDLLETFCLFAHLWNTLATLSLWQIQGCFRAWRRKRRREWRRRWLVWKKNCKNWNLFCTNPLCWVHCKHLVDQVLRLQRREFNMKFIFKIIFKITISKVISWGVKVKDAMLVSLFPSPRSIEIHPFLQRREWVCGAVFNEIENRQKWRRWQYFRRDWI